MNYKMIINIVGKMMVLLALMMLLPLFVSIIYSEGIRNVLSFLIPIVIFGGLGLLLSYNKLKKEKIGAKEGIIIVGLTWIIISLFGCIPFLISKEIPNFFDAFFEMASGFTTTGASILQDVEKLSYSMIFWRSFSHWIGGMGVLVFILALIPESKEGSSMHILRAESAGPQVGKLVSKMKATSRILYLIYFTLTILEILFLTLGPDEKMTFFNSVIYSLGTAGTGGFSMDSTGLQFYSSYSQYVIAIFMLIFGINFSMFYLILIKNYKEVFKNEELKLYFIIVIASVALITANIYSIYKDFGDSFRLAFFQVVSIITTTGYSTVNYSTWPSITLIIIICLTAFGACAGSTAGGIKLSRIIILFKTFIRKVKQTISPRKVESIKINGKIVDDNTVEGVQSYIVAYIIILLLCAFLISVDGFDITTNITASLTCISNVGPGLSDVGAGLIDIGPAGNFSGFSNFSKFILTVEMIAGRLEIFPILVLFSKNTWSNK